jgi:kynurenine formamidase
VSGRALKGTGGVRILDLSHPVRNAATCSFEVVDSVPQISFQEGIAHGGGAISARIDNLVMDSYTHVVLPGSRRQSGSSERTVGEYPLESFVGPAVVVDVADLTAGLDPFFDAEGRLAVDPRDEGAGLAFLQALDGLEVTREELAARLAQTGAGPEVRGVLFHSGLARHWTYQKLQAWEHRYFFSPFPSPEACQDLAAAGISFVGIDSLQIDSPWLNLSGQEIPFVLHASCRRRIAERRAAARPGALAALFAGDVVVYLNLNLPETLAGRVVEFAGPPWNLQIEGATTSSVVRPFARLAGSPGGAALL